MAKLHKKVAGILDAQLRDFEDHLEDLPRGRISGVIVSSSFDSMDHQTRQEKLAQILQARLTESEWSAVGAIAALTPAEMHVKA